jgi:ABC-2 type transport system permease protein
MKTTPSTRENLRIVWAITRKDLIDAIKNKNILTILLSALFVVAVYKYLPQLTAEDGPPALLIYDPNSSQFLADLEHNSDLDVYTYESQEDMQYYLTNGEVPELGLVIPGDIDARAAAGSPLQFQGYALEIFKDEEIFNLERAMETEFETILGQPVDIRVERLPLQAETYGVTVMVGMGFVFVTLMVGMLVIPHMMIEEKQGKTLAALMVSPARSIHILVSKALTGLIYALGMLLVTVGLNWNLVPQKWLFLLTGILGSLFAIGIGLLLGILIDSRQQLTLWAWAAIIPLYIPMMLALLDDLIPPLWVQVFKWFPATALFRAFRTAMAGSTPTQYYAPQLALVAACALVVLVIDAYLVKRLER